jgi:replicative DNA helicase
MNYIADYDHEFMHNLEKSIIGSLLVDDRDEVKALVLRHNIEAKDFSDMFHRFVFTSILKCYEAGVKVDIVSVNEFKPQALPDWLAGQWQFKLVDLTQFVATTAHLEHHILKFKEFVIIRHWVDVSSKIQAIDWKGMDVFTVSDNILRGYKKLIDRFTKDIQNNSEKDYVAQITDRYKKHLSGEHTALPTGSLEFDQLLQGGMQFGELIIVAGRPGMLKTTVALITAWECHKRGHAVVFFSLEMPVFQLRSKIIAKETGVNYNKIKSGKLTAEELAKVTKFSEQMDQSSFTIIGDLKHIDDISLKTKELRKEGLCDLIVVDYIQRCSYPGHDLRQGITYITRELKSIAKDNNIPVMALSQLSRKVEERDNKRPRLSDLKESSSIEEDADIVLFPYREAYYTLKSANASVPPNDMWKVEFNLGKGRDIGVGGTTLKVNPISLSIDPYSYVI